MVHSFFHWDLEFPDIFYDGNGRRKDNPGFDGVIGNPPWDILKPDVEEFFAPFYEQKYQKSFRTLTKMQKNKFVNAQLEDDIINEEWRKYKKMFEKQTHYYNNSKYSFQTSIIHGKKYSSDINLYKLFLEQAYKILSINKLCGFVIPSGLYLDMGTRKLRELFFENTQILLLYSFINKKGIFAGIHRQFKFCLFVFKKGGNTTKFLANFYIENMSDSKTLADHAFEMSLNLIQLSSPTALSIIECKNSTVATIFEKLYQNPILSSKDWALQARSELHMTNNSNLFHTKETGLPLYEGKMIYQFQNTLLPPTYYINENVGTKHLTTKEQKRINKKTNAIIKPKIDFYYYRLVWRDVTNAVDRRTLISTILPPKVFLGNTLSYIVPVMFDGTKYTKTLTIKEMIYLCGMLNSFPVDFILRHRVNLHVSIFHLMELPIPKFDNENILHQKLVDNATKLICTTDEFNELKKEIEVKSVTNSNERLTLQAQINALSAKIYRLNNNELELILQYFAIENENLKQETLNEFTKI